MGSRAGESSLERGSNCERQGWRAGRAGGPRKQRKAAIPEGEGGRKRNERPLFLLFFETATARTYARPPTQPYPAARQLSHFNY
jgi:hypothetical protein